MYSSNSSPSAINCIFWGNSSEIYTDNNSLLTITYSIVQGGYSPCSNCPSGDGNVDWSGNGLTVKLPTSGSAAVSLDTMASLKWTPYSYRAGSGWTAADINAYYNDLSGQLGRAFSSITDPNQAATQQTMARILYMTVYDGNSNVVQIDNRIVPSKAAQPDPPIALSLTAEIGEVLAEAVDTYFTYNDALESIAASFPEDVASDVVLTEYLSQDIFTQLDASDGFASLTFGVVALVMQFTEFLIADVLHDANSPFGQSFGNVVNIVTVISDAKTLFSEVKTTIQVAQSLADIDETVSFSEALLDVLSNDSALIDTSRLLGVMGLVISGVVAIGVPVAVAATNALIAAAAERPTAIARRRAVAR